MTLIIAIFILITIPIFTTLLKKRERNRLLAFTAIAMMPFLEGLPIIGFLYGWPNWSGISRGISVSLGDALAVALILSRRDFVKKQLFWPLFAFYGLGLFTSIFVSTNWIGTLFVWWQFAKMLLIFAVVAGEAHRIEVRNSLMTGLALGLAYQAFSVVSQKASGTIQAAGTLSSQNLLGLMVELSLVPLIGAALAGNRNRMLMPGIVAGLICAAGTGSRATLAFAAAAIAGLLLVSLLRRSTPRKLKAIFLSVIALLMASPLAYSTLSSRFEGRITVDEDLTRVAFEDAAKSMASDYPMGVGANMFVWISIHEEYAARAGVAPRYEDRSKPVHNAYLLARAETGWHGQLAFVLMLSVPILVGFRAAFLDRSRPEGEMALACAFALLAIAIHNNWEFDLHSAVVQYLLFINFGIISALYREFSESSRGSKLDEKIEKPNNIAVGRLIY